ncbi:MAG: DUF4080 domain-containing protein [Ruminococcaceae bacterium]|nr:DUF4080 domain-containing protein [Oscillospiraceae bacterium]
MKAVIVSLTSQYIHSSLAPWYLLASVKGKNADCFVVEGTVNEEFNVLLNRINDQKADLVAFSCYIWNITTVLSLAPKIKNAKILLGGPEVSYCAEKILKENPFVDFVISGEGEKPFTKLLDFLCGKGKLNEIEGLCYRQNKKMVIKAPYVTEEIPPSPYIKEYFGSLSGRISYIESSRGCPFSCAFCLSGRCGGVRYFPIDRTKKEIIALSNSGSKIIKFVDRTFNSNSIRAREIFEFIIENYEKAFSNDVCFHFEIAGDLLKKEDFALLKKAPKGVIQFEIGMQSFNSETLSAIYRKTNIKHLKENIKKLVKMGNIHTHIDLIAGLPKEDYKSFRDSFNTAFYLNADKLQLGFLKLLYGTPMRENSDDFPIEFLSEPPYEVTKTPWLSSSQISMLHSLENALERLVNSGRFSRTVNYLFNEQKRNPFDTLTQIGMFTGNASIPLNQYVDSVYHYFEKGSDEKRIRDLLLCDIAESVRSTTLPKSLAVEDKRLKKFRSFLEQNETTKKRKGVMRKTFLLYTENCGAYVDYDEKINGKYKVKKIEFDLS